MNGELHEAVAHWRAKPIFHKTRDTGFCSPAWRKLAAGPAHQATKRRYGVLLDLVPAVQHQPDLFAADDDRRRKLSPLIDRVHHRYGRCAIDAACFRSMCGCSRAMPAFTG
ncbi:MAG: hypothetical protein JOY83_26415 [Alphaproteobacteria bacterium]|nr:hypothetical protein [Alphaproteobacteria bacterium]